MNPDVFLACALLLAWSVPFSIFGAAWIRRRRRGHGLRPQDICAVTWTCPHCTKEIVVGHAEHVAHETARQFLDESALHHLDEHAAVRQEEL